MPFVSVMPTKALAIFVDGGASDTLSENGVHVSSSKRGASNSPKFHER
jgi:hypothetical protein